MPNRSTSWGGVADWYDRLLKQDEDSYQRRVILPNLLRLMAIAPGERILDVACGPGFFSAAFVHAGGEVTGVDVDERLVALARRNVPAPDRGKRGARFLVAPSDRLRGVPDASADKAVVVLAVQNIDDVKGTFAECRRALVPGGRLYLVMNHPAFRVPKSSSWGWDRKGAQYRRVDKYLTEGKVRIAMHPGDEPELSTVSFHRPLQFYVKALAKNGFLVANLEEWTSHKKSDSGPRAAEENRARREIPLFLFLEAVRTA